jgi:hypothetical protein
MEAKLNDVQKSVAGGAKPSNNFTKNAIDVLVLMCPFGKRV